MSALIVTMPETFTLIEFPGYGTNYLALTSTSPYQSSKLLFRTIYGNTSPQISLLTIPAPIITAVDAASAMILD